MTKISRNDPCWCGSGKKYKKCHMNSDADKTTTPPPVLPPKGVIIKTSEQIDGIRKSSQITKAALDMIAPYVKEGITTNEINKLIHDFTISKGAIPAPLNYNGFPKSVCTSLNSVICHGIPDETVLKDGDIINIDVTSIYNGYYGDASRMYMVGNVSAEAKKLVRVAKECLDIGINIARPYADIGEIGYAIEKHAKANGYSVVRDYGGHGVGVQFHEEPHIHHYGEKKRGVHLIPGMTFTIEPMINMGKYHSKVLKDNWTAVTKDDTLSAQWEHTLLVTKTGIEILTE